MERLRFEKMFLCSMFVGFLMLCLIGCQPKVRGTIFLDENGNNLFDPGEKRLGRVLFSVSLGGAHLQDGISNVDGSYEVKTKEDGRYCIEVGSVETQKPIVSSNVPPDRGVSTAKAVGMEPGGEPTGVVGSGTSSDAEDEEEEEGEEEPAPTTPPAETRPSVQDCKACINVTLSDKDLNVPVGKKYSISQIPDLPPIDVKAGDVVEVGFIGPGSCMQQIRPIYIASPHVQAGDFWRRGITAGVTVVNFGESEAVTVSGSVRSIREDKLVEKTVALITDPGILDGEETVVLETDARCPDPNMQPIPLRRTLKIHGRFPIDISAKLLTLIDTLKDQLGSEGEISIQYILENKRGIDYKDIEFEVGVTGLMVKSARTENNDCEKRGGIAACEFELRQGESKTLTFKFQGPEDYGDYKTSVTIRIKDETVPLTKEVEEVVSFTIPSQEDNADGEGEEGNQP